MEPVTDSQSQVVARETFDVLHIGEVSEESSTGQKTPVMKHKHGGKSIRLVKGEIIYAVGYCLQEPLKNTSDHLEPLVTRGVISKVVRAREGREVMLMTTAVVHSGMSGGMIVSATTGEGLGMIVSNSK